MNAIDALLMAHHSAVACRVLIALLLLGPLPVTSSAIGDRYLMDNESVNKGLKVLKTFGLALNDGNGSRSAWRLTPQGRQLALDIFHLAEAVPAEQALPAPLPFQLDDAGPVAVKPQPSETLENQADPAPESVAVKPQLDARINSIYRSSPSLTDSVNTTNTRPAVAVKPQPKRRRARTASSHAAHVADITAALLLKGLPRPTTDDYLPPDLRLCAQQLVALGCSPDRAEAAVVKSGWPAEKIAEQLAIWKVYPDCPMGANLKNSIALPFTAARRIEEMVECPFDNRQPTTPADKYAGYLQPDADSER